MKKMMERIWEKKNSKKGFTLVELIVVLVILAILAAIMIPALSGWITKAKEKQLILDARNVEMATQAALYEEYGKIKGDLKGAELNLQAGTGTDSDSILSNLQNYIEDITDIDVTSAKTCTVKYGTSGTIESFTYKGATDTQTATYSSTSGWTVS